MALGHAAFFSRLQNKKPTSLSSLQPADQANDDGTVTSSHNKHTLAFEIPLNETESAGLGLSVKGNSVEDSGKLIETGIFIKSVIAGGAAHKVRLKLQTFVYKFFFIPD